MRTMGTGRKKHALVNLLALVGGGRVGGGGWNLTIGVGRWLYNNGTCLSPFHITGWEGEEGRDGEEKKGTTEPSCFVEIFAGLRDVVLWFHHEDQKRATE